MAGALLGARTVQRRVVADVRERVPGVTVMVRPECKHEEVLAADRVGSTEAIIKADAEAAAGTSWAIGTGASTLRDGDPAPIDV